MIKIKKGLDVPIEGEPARTVISAPRSRSVALIGFDYVGMKPTMLVKEGDKVAKGQVLFEGLPIWTYVLRVCEISK